MATNNLENNFEQQQQGDQSAFQQPQNNFWQNTYQEIAQLTNNGSGGNSTGGGMDGQSLNFGDTSALYNGSASGDTAMTALQQDFTNLSNSLSQGDVAGTLNALGQTLKDVSADLPAQSSSGSNNDSTATSGGTAATGGDNTSGGTTAASGDNTSSAYNPANDAALQNLSNTGDSQLQQTLLSAYGDVQNGTLSQSAYSQFENAAIPLTDPVADANAGLNFSSDTPLEQTALNYIQGNINSDDASTLQGLIGPSGDTTTGGSATDGGTASGSTAGSTGSGSDSGSNSGSTGSDQAAANGSAAPISLTDMLNQQNQADNTVLPSGGVQSDGFGWAKGATPNWPNPDMPSDANGVVSWMDAYPGSGTAETQGANIQVNDMNAYALLNNGTWEQISSGNNGNNWAENNPNDMNGITGSPTITQNADGSFSMPTAADGQIDQFGAGGGSINASDIQGVYISAQVKSDLADPNTVVQMGGDWYKDGQYEQGIATGNWVNLTNQYQTATMTNIDAATLAADPPPGVTAS